jgi:hypothetical protein
MAAASAAAASSAAATTRRNFSQNLEKAANLSVLMAKVQSMEIVVDES